MELLERARTIAGLPLAALAAKQGQELPRDLRRHKGWAGQLLEAVLGANAGPAPLPDFVSIGVELKTLPVDRHGLPRESTYVCTVQLEGSGETWDNCWLRHKLARVLWLPLEAEPSIPIGERRVGTALLWSPSPEEEVLLRRDWEELTERIALGELDQINAQHGEALQIRPKAANSRTLRYTIDYKGERTQTNPRGFYLRPTFTAAILRRHFVLPD